ncbi:cyanoexosortase B system-associated protein [filamentous cyanobacterium LEGE 11480]|uniref:Cyanoexosortase B system-associated protein n=1 Tax=Romeriopsis navalis LEGE 11480 TaxID=2777977 RepID=A0A928Z238_9CYAN|nr:cyanoexosortase B system-associated protein [Romeriopsis navalis]MBE9029134.1 cyanoexosortase B system-associated protein [Romeriopsis navalis LEGE 11480]
MLLSVPRSWHLSRAKLVLLVFLAVLLVIGAVPNYIGQKWQWKMPPPVTQLKQLREIRQQGVPIQNWKNNDEQPVILGDHHWYLQNMANGEQKASLFLMPQSGPKRQPQVEWSDIEGIQRWQSDSYKTLKIGLSEPNQQFETRFFRAWTRSRTYAVAQWYAQSNGGSPIASKWYVADRLAQWQHKRVPWIAVSVQMPIAPLDDLDKYEAQVTALAQTIQTSLNHQIFHPKAASPT